MALFNFLKNKQPNTKKSVEPSPAPAKKVTVTPPIEATRVETIVQPATPPPKEKPMDLGVIRHELEEIAELIGPGDGYTLLGREEGDLTGLDLPLDEVTALFPEGLLKPGMPPAEAPHKVTILIEDVFSQLKKGMVTTTIRRMISELPTDWFTDQLVKRAGDLITVPLSLVVSHINPEELTSRTAVQPRDTSAAALPDVFKQDGIEPVAPPPPVEPAPEPEPEPELPADDAWMPPSYNLDETDEEPTPQDETEPLVVIEDEEVPEPEESVVAIESEPTLEPELEPEPEYIPEPVVDTLPDPELEPAADIIPEPAPLPEPVAEVAPEPEPEIEPVVEEQPAPVAASVPAPGKPAIEAPEETIPIEEDVPSGGATLFLRGLDLNRATEEELYTRLDGVGPVLAQRIVQDREDNGPFFYLLDLPRVPGLGRKTFEQITGLPLQRDTFRYLPIVHKVLGPGMEGIPNVREVAARFAQISGFEGCLLCHEDGYVLASSWEHSRKDAFGAFAPQMYKKVSKYVRQLDLGGLGSMTFYLEMQPFTLVHSGEIYLVAVHESAHFSRKQVHLAQAVGAELGRRLGRHMHS